MNDALDFYQENNTVWHISGWNYPINQDKIEDVFLWRLMNCWGWATWKKEWSFFEKDPYFLIKNFKKTDIHKFNLDGAENFWNQVLQNKKGEINSWAVFWYATIFNKNKLCLNPRISLTQNIGIGKNSTNTSKVCRIFETRLKKEKIIKFDFPKKLKENLFVFNLIKNQFIKNNRNSFLKKLFS